MRIIKNGVLFIFCLIVAVGCNNLENEKTNIIRKVKLAQVCQADSLEQHTFSGIISEKNNLNLAFRVAGPIFQIKVKEGDYVKKGQLIASMDPRDYEIQLAAALGQYESVKAEADRVIELHDRNSVANNDYDKAVSGVKMVEANLGHAKDQLNDTKLYAPASGFIQDINFEEGEMVDAGMPVATLIDVTNYSLEVDIPVSLYIRKNDFVSFSGSQPLVSENKFPLQLTGFSKKANNNQLYTLKLNLSSAGNLDLSPGMNTEVTITMKTGIQNILSVPLNAVFEKNGESYVWIYLPDEGVVKSRKITTGQLSGRNLISVVSGLEVGEQVVAAGVHQLQENQQVDILETVSETNVGGML